MANYNDAALSEEEYKEIRQAVIDTPFDVKLSGRQVIAVKKVSPGRQVYEYRTMNRTGDAEHVAKGAEFPGMVINKTETVVKIVKTGVAFEIFREDVQSSRENGEALDTSYARQAARKTDIKENNLIWNGSSTFGVTGIYASAGKTLAGSDWTAVGTGPYEDIRKAKALLDEDFTADVFVTHPTQYSELFKRESNTQFIMNELIKDGLGVNTFKDTAFTAGTGLLFESNPDNAEIIVAEERQLENAYTLATQAWKFNVFVRSSPVVYQANAFCTLTGI